MAKDLNAVNSFCPQAELCSVCHWIDLPRDQQLNAKSHILAQTLQRLGQLPQFRVIDLGPGYLRTRVDLTLSSVGNLGFYKRDSEEIFNLGPCPQLTPELKTFLSEFQQSYLPRVLDRGSVRLRVFLDSDQEVQRGVWFDFSHIDTKSLLDQRELLASLSGNAVVEVGQRRKSLFFAEEEERFKLREPGYHYWATSHTSKKTIPLYGQVASFTQTGPAAEQAMGQFVSRWVQALRPKVVQEFGPGLGTLSFAAAEFAEQEWRGYESDAYAVGSLKKTISEQPEFFEKMKIHQGNFHRAQSIENSDEDLFLLNPPRSGIGSFMESVAHPPKNILYISCFIESFEKDMRALIPLGYQLVDCELLDQFPQSKHFEILTVWQKS